MSKKRFSGHENAEVIYFISKNENTLPSSDGLMGQIRKCLPSDFSPGLCFSSTFGKFPHSEWSISHFIEKVDSNRYKITVYYQLDTLGLIEGAKGLIAFILGGAIGYNFYQEIGALVGAILGTILVLGIFGGKDQKEAEKACERIISGIKEYERAHLLSIGAGKDN